MGFHGCHLAAKHVDLADLAEKIGFQITESAVEHPFEVQHCAGTLKGGWTICVLSDWDERLVQPALLEAISKNATIVACLIDEASMICASECWKDGRRLWHVLHDPQTGDVNHLEITGTDIPEEVTAYRHNAIVERKSDSEIDFMFDVPMLLARDLTGFKHDEAMPDEAKFFEIKLNTPSRPSSGWPASKPWWKLW